MLVIDSERLYLRELTKEDKGELMKVLCDEESMQYYPHPFSEDKVEKWIDWNIESYRIYKHGLWAVILKEGELLIGDCGITMQQIEDELVPELGFHINKNYCNNGYATEAARACVHYAFTKLKYSRLYSYTSADNTPSQKVAKKVGMNLYKHIDKNGQRQIVQILINHEYEDILEGDTL